MLLWPQAPLPTVHTARLLLRLPQPKDYAEWRQVRLSSRAHLEPFEPRWEEQDHRRGAFVQRTKRSTAQARAGTDYSFLIFLTDKPRPSLIGGVTLSNIRYGVSHNANLGYWMGKDHAGQGLMTEAVGALCDFAFTELRLNRIHAAFLPHNAASRRVLEKNRFVEEGFAEQYLLINGAWQDHVLCGLTRNRWLMTRA